MDELYSKLKDILAENTRLKHINVDLQLKIDQLEEELRMRSLPRDEEHEKEWWSSKQSELIEENVMLKESLKRYEKDGAETWRIPGEWRKSIDDSERKHLNEVVEENKRIKDENIRNTDVQKRADAFLENNKILKVKLAETEEELKSYKTYCKRFTKVVTGLLGYKVELSNDKITLLSLYAFSADDVFVFNQSSDNLQLITNDFAMGWQTEIQNYLVNGRSLPAFLSCVTLELFNRKTFG